MPRKKPDPIHEELMAFLEMTPWQREAPKTRARWLALWQGHFAGEKMQAANVHHADLITYLGAEQAMQDGDYPKALGYLDSFFAHPQAEHVDIISLMNLRSDRMLCLFHVGEEVQAITVGRSLLAYERRSDLRAAMLILQAPLYVYLLQCEPEQIASVAMTEFLWEVAQAIHPRARRRLPSPAPYTQLAEALNQTWPRAERERIRQGWSAYAQERNQLLQSRRTQSEP